MRDGPAKPPMLPRPLTHAMVMARVAAAWRSLTCIQMDIVAAMAPAAAMPKLMSRRMVACGVWTKMDAAR